MVSCKIWNFPNLAGKIWNFPNLAGKIWNFPNLAGKIWNFPNLAGKIWNFPNLAGKIWNFPNLEFSQSCLQDLLIFPILMIFQILYARFRKVKILPARFLLFEVLLSTRKSGNFQYIYRDVKLRKS